MNLLQKIRCFRCPRQADCLMMKALLAQYDQWEKDEKPKLDAAMKRADALLKRMEENPL